MINETFSRLKTSKNTTSRPIHNMNTKYFKNVALRKPKEKIISFLIKSFARIQKKKSQIGMNW